MVISQSKENLFSIKSDLSRSKSARGLFHFKFCNFYLLDCLFGDFRRAGKSFGQVQTNFSFLKSFHNPLLHWQKSLKCANSIKEMPKCFSRELAQNPLLRELFINMTCIACRRLSQHDRACTSVRARVERNARETCEIF